MQQEMSVSLAQMCNQSLLNASSISLDRNAAEPGAKDWSKANIARQGANEEYRQYSGYREEKMTQEISKKLTQPNETFFELSGAKKQIDSKRGMQEDQTHSTDVNSSCCFKIGGHKNKTLKISEDALEKAAKMVGLEDNGRGGGDGDGDEDGDKGQSTF